MEKVYVLIETCERWEPYGKNESLVDVCKTKESVIKCANAYIKRMQKLFSLWNDGKDASFVCDFRDKEVTEDELFKLYTTNDDWIFIPYVFYTEHNDGFRRQEWSIHIEERQLK